MIESLKSKSETLDVFEITKEVLKQSGLYKLYKDDESLQGINRIQNIEELLNGIKDFIENENNKDVSSFLQSVALMTDQDSDDDSDDKVSLMTVHLAKGLEFNCVYIVGLEENLFPSAMNLNSRNDLEEERRLFYVALTRAQRKIYLSYVLSRYRWGKLIESEKSRFIDEIDDDFLENNNRNPSSEFSRFENVSKSVGLRYKRLEKDHHQILPKLSLAQAFRDLKKI